MCCVLTQIMLYFMKATTRNISIIPVSRLAAAGLSSITDNRHSPPPPQRHIKALSPDVHLITDLQPSLKDMRGGLHRLWVSSRCDSYYSRTNSNNEYIWTVFISVFNHRCDDTRGCVMQFWPPDDEHMCSKHVEAWNKTYCETNFVHQVG